MAAGQPRFYKTPEELNEACEAYFAECENNKERPLLTGLTLFLGFADKSSLYDYRDKPEYFHPIKRALLRIEVEYEKGLTEQSVAGRIFALKNMGWKDKQEQEVYGKDGAPLVNLIFPDGD